MAKDKVHILGICGTFMGGLALLGKEEGIEISGCDTNIYPPMSDHLREMGIEIIEGYDANKLPDADFYVIGNSISRGNPALEHLLSSQANLISGPEWLYKTILKNKKVIAVSGTHGKTTTTAMLAYIFENQGIDAGYLIAGKPKDFSKSARKGTSEIFVIEADEYDTAFFDKRSKFIHYKPDTLIINNLEYDHADIFPDISYIFREFHHLIRTLKEEANIIFPSDDSNITKVLDLGCWSKLISYDFNGKHENSLNIQDDALKPLLRIRNQEESIDWQMFGEHNARNAMVAVLAADQYGVSLKDSISSLKKFRGVAKRQDLLLNTDELIIIEDFAHHPTAIQTTIEGIKKNYPDHILTAAIELRSNTMKSGLHDDRLAEAVSSADKVYWKSEDRFQIKRLVDSLPNKSVPLDNNKSFINDFESMNSKKDILIIMSNGDFNGLSRDLLDKYRND